jgi:sulfite reductase subunit B
MNMPGKNDDTFKPKLARIDSVTAENPDIKTLRLSFPKKQDSDSFSFAPGQLAMFSIPGIGEAPFSMCSPPGEKKYLEISVRKIGNVTDAICNLKKGDSIWVRGPYGHGYPIDKMQGKDIILVAGGIGFPPLASVIEHVIKNRNDYGNIWVLYGVKNFDDLIYKDRIKRWSRVKDLEVLVTVETPCSKWNGCVGVVTKLFEKLKIDEKNTVGLSCGPPIMLKFVTLGLLDMGINEGDVYLSLERMMQCGIGKCGHCNIGEKYVCTDGPVFGYTEIKKMVERVW